MSGVLRKINLQNIDIRKAAWLSIVLNLLQIVAVIVLVVMVFLSQKRDISAEAEQWVVLAGALLVILGALTDIGSARMNLRFSFYSSSAVTNAMSCAIAFSMELGTSPRSSIICSL